MAEDHIWSSKRYWDKAVLYVERAAQLGSRDDARVLFRALALEFLARAVLTNVHPVLNADPQGDGAHILYAFGFVSGKQQPKSIPAHAVYGRLARMHPEFAPHKAICEYMGNLRNRELHTGELAFATTPEKDWLAQYYAACQTLCGLLEREPAELLGAEARHAEELVKALESKQRGDVLKRVAAHKRVFNDKPEDERERLRLQASISSTRRRGGTKCPACTCVALRSGVPILSSRPRYSQGALLVETTYATRAMQCSACGLHLRGVAECHFAEVEPRFAATAITDLHAMHEDEEYDEYDNM